MWFKIKHFYQQYVPTSDRTLLVLLLSAILLGLAFIVINMFTTTFHGFHYGSPMVTPKLLVMAFFWCISLYFMKKAPRLGFTVRTVTIGQLIYCAGGILATGTQYTPFPTIDHLLFKTDLWFGIQTNNLLAWIHQHTLLVRILELSYNSLGPQLFFLPLILALLLEYKAVNELLLGALLAFIIGCIIYYFFPANGPVSMINSPYFSAKEHDTVMKFFELHHHLPLTTTLGGLLTFPSFHTIWLLQLTYACYRRKWLFYPIAVFNSFAISATVLLGWHYVIDVIGGAVFMVCALFIIKPFANPTGPYS